MSEVYEWLSQGLLIKKRCIHRGIMLPVEPGCQVVYEGQTYRILAVRKEQLAVIQEMTSIPIKEESIMYFSNWLEDDRCIIIPSVEMLLQVIFDVSGFYPTLVPGVEATREVWKVQHPSAAQPYIFKSPLESLIHLTVTLLQSNKS